MTIPNSVTEIGDWAFWNCTGLTSVTIGNSVTSIVDYAFADCTGLNDIYSRISNPANVTLGRSVFYNVPSTCVLHVPKGTISEYRSAWLTNKVEFIMGNVDGSEVLDVTDVVLSASFAMGETLSNFDVFVADMDENGIVDVTDVVMLAEIVMGQ